MIQLKLDELNTCLIRERDLAYGVLAWFGEQEKKISR